MMTKEEMEAKYVNPPGGSILVKVLRALDYDHVEGAKLMVFVAAGIVAAEEIMKDNPIMSKEGMVEFFNQAYEISKQEFIRVKNKGIDVNI